jgi:hypothetical protein
LGEITSDRISNSVIVGVWLMRVFYHIPRSKMNPFWILGRCPRERSERREDRRWRAAWFICGGIRGSSLLFRVKADAALFGP